MHHLQGAGVDAEFHAGGVKDHVHEQGVVRRHGAGDRILGQPGDVQGARRQLLNRGKGVNAPIAKDIVGEVWTGTAPGAVLEGQLGHGVLREEVPDGLAVYGGIHRAQ